MLVQLLGGRRTQRAGRHGCCLHHGHQPRERQPPDRPRVARGMPIRHVGTLARCVFLSTLMLGVCRESRAQRPDTTSPMYRKAPLCRRAAVLTSTKKIRSGRRATPVIVNGKAATRQYAVMLHGNTYYEVVTRYIVHQSVEAGVEHRSSVMIGHRTSGDGRKPLVACSLFET